MKTAMIQMPVTDSKEQNIQTALEYLKKAVQEGAELAVLPEMFCSLYHNRDFRKNAEGHQGPAWQAMAGAAADLSLWLVAGSIPEQDGDRLYNTSFVFDPRGHQAARHRKIHMFDIQVTNGQCFRESDTFTPGNEVTVFDTPFGRLGLCICFDLRFPELSMLMALKGAQAMIVPAAFNMTTGPAHWELLFRQRAVDNQLHTIGVAPARDLNSPYVSYANSILCSPWGEVLHRAGHEPELIVADIDLEQNKAIREQLPLLSARRTDVYGTIEK